MEPERTKAMPNPGLELISGKTEKINWVEKDDRVVELEVGFSGICEEWKNRPMENWLESLVSRITGGSSWASPVRRRLVVALKEL